MSEEDCEPSAGLPVGDLLAQLDWIKDQVEERAALRGWADNGIPRSGVLRLHRGHRHQIVPLPDMRRLVKATLFAVWHSRSSPTILCPAHSGSALIERRACTACEAGIDCWMNVYLPVLLASSWDDERRRWHPYRDPWDRPRLLALPAAKYKEQAEAMDCGGQIWQVTRADDEYGTYDLRRAESYRPDKWQLLQALRRFPVPDLRDAPEDLDALAANAKNEPGPGQAERLLRAFPGAVLIPCGLGFKRPRVQNS